MQIVYYKDPIGNFGDDLNELIWPLVLPPDIRDAPNAVLVGIGSLLDHRRFVDIDLDRKRVYVLGSGAAYGRLPPSMENWIFLAVRGKLTARLIGQPMASVTDSAALLARLPDLVPPNLASGAAGRGEILFMPHHCSVSNSNWPAAAAQAGMTYVDPQWRPERILEHYGRARMVVTEAMHGAIVADTLRIPWIPVIISPQVSVFKWRDWASSLDLPYRPVALPPSARLETMKYDRITRLTRASGSTVAHVGAADLADDDLIEDFNQRYADAELAIGAPAAPGGLKALARAIIPLFDGARIEAAAKALRMAAAGESFLSRDAIFEQRVAALEGAVAHLIADLRARAASS
jgi:succinoglycan biosynthesis protein ExoV